MIYERYRILRTGELICCDSDVVHFIEKMLCIAWPKIKIERGGNKIISKNHKLFYGHVIRRGKVKQKE